MFGTAEMLAAVALVLFVAGAICLRWRRLSSALLVAGAAALAGCLLSAWGVASAAPVTGARKHPHPSPSPSGIHLPHVNPRGVLNGLHGLVPAHFYWTGKEVGALALVIVVLVLWTRSRRRRAGG